MVLCAEKKSNFEQKSSKNFNFHNFIYEKIGDFNLVHNKYKKAIFAYKKACKPINKNILLKLATVIQTYFPNKTNTAIKYYNEALKLTDEKGYIYYELGNLYLQKEDLFNASSAFKLAIESDSENAFFHNAYAYTMFNSKLYEEAETHYKLAITLNPDNIWTAQVIKALSLIYSDINKDNQKAIDTLKKSIQLNPDDFETYMLIADLYVKENELSNSIDYYCKAIKHSPNNYKLYNKFGATLYEIGCKDEAIIALNKAIEIKPEYEPAYNNLGVIYLEGMDNPLKASNYFKQAIKINPAYTQAFYNLGKCYQKLKLTKETAQMYRIALTLNKTDKSIDLSELESNMQNLFSI